MAFSKELIEKYAPGADCVEPMGIWKLPKGKENMFTQLAESGDYFAEVKKDGYWYQYEKTTDGQVYLFSRSVSKTTGILTEKSENVPHIIEALQAVPNGTTIIGEIYYPGKESKDVTRIMGCLADKAIQRQEEEGYIHFYIHDMIKYKNVDFKNVGASERYDALKVMYNDQALYEYPYIELANAYYENIPEKVIDVLDQGEEGMVLKRKTSPYTPGKRPAWATLKIKKVDYLDAVCLGFCDATKEYTGKDLDNWNFNTSVDDNRLQGSYKTLCEEYDKDNVIPVTKGYYYGWKTAIRVGAYTDEGELIEIGTVASGLTDELREDFAQNPDKYLNKVVKIQCMELDKQALSLRHPFFKGFRDDKDPEQCLISDIF